MCAPLLVYKCVNHLCPIYFVNILDDGRSFPRLCFDGARNLMMSKHSTWCINLARSNREHALGVARPASVSFGVLPFARPATVSFRVSPVLRALRVSPFARPSGCRLPFAHPSGCRLLRALQLSRLGCRLSRGASRPSLRSLSAESRFIAATPASFEVSTLVSVVVGYAWAV